MAADFMDEQRVRANYGGNFRSASIPTESPALVRLEVVGDFLAVGGRQGVQLLGICFWDEGR
jgi:hypothetical protein